MILESAGSDDEISMPVGPMRAGDETRTLGRRNRVARFPRKLRRTPIDLERAFAEPVFIELETRSGERVGFDDVGAGREICLVDSRDEIGPRKNERFVAAVVARSAEVGSGKFERHELRAHGAVEEKHPLPEQAQIVGHVLARFFDGDIGRADLSDRASGPIIHDRGAQIEPISTTISSSSTPSRRSAAMVDGPRARLAAVDDFGGEPQPVRDGGDAVQRLRRRPCRRSLRRRLAS